MLAHGHGDDLAHRGGVPVAAEALGHQLQPITMVRVHADTRFNHAPVRRSGVAAPMQRKAAQRLA